MWFVQTVAIQWALGARSRMCLSYNSKANLLSCLILNVKLSLYHENLEAGSTNS
jgi:hypothetical protein